MADQNEHVDNLRQLISDEIIKAVGLSASRWTRWLFWNVFRTPAERFAQIGASFDHWVASSGFSAAARNILPRFVSRYESRGADSIPNHGPLLIASNHPGTYDALVIAAHMPRNDLKIVSSDIPFLAGLPSTRQHMIFTTLDAHVRMSVFRSALRHLQSGGALLIFPSGHIDPDPSVLPGAVEAIERWSRSVEMMLHRVPHANLLVTIVSGVVARACAHSPLVRLRRKPLDRRRLAEFIQVIQQMFFERKYNLTPKVTFAPPAAAGRLLDQAGNQTLTQTVIQSAKRLLDEHFLELQPSPA